MKKNILLISALLFTLSLTGCGKKLVPDSEKSQTVWQEVEVKDIEAAEFKASVKDAGLSKTTNPGSSSLLYNVVAGVYHIGKVAVNGVAKGVSAIDSSMTEGAGAVLIVDRLDDNSTETKRTVTLRVSEDEVIPDAVNTIFLDGTHSDETKVEIGTHLAGLYSPNGHLIRLSSDLDRVGKSVQTLEDEGN
jgi:predicted small lipoprotein YifL